MLNDKEFLTWLHERLEFVHHEPINAEYMHRFRKIIASIETPIPSPFPKPTPEVQVLRNVSQLLYDAWIIAEHNGNEPTDKTEAASQVAWNAYVKVRNLLGDNVK